MARIPDDYLDEDGKSDEEDPRIFVTGPRFKCVECGQQAVREVLGGDDLFHCLNCGRSSCCHPRNERELANV